MIKSLKKHHCFSVYLDFEESWRVYEKTGEEDSNDVEAELPVAGVAVRVADAEEPLSRDSQTRVCRP